ncbi:beta-glucosidase [Rhizocola hellebori]|uniref:Beta-glucosidase n=1 Tax=Rhizocola hellebori TaxID=1392758 RepID=A0A8J3Q8Q1_9ACTN|nr:glycoside hydrolase family 3 N-terminal domain-containing protein [Rhizocola hellebori]GIH05956.1 beta-glucosidase [Rhizocola hellebori]
MGTPRMLNDHEPWRDPTLTVAERVADLLQRMTLQEKVAQLYSVWIGMDSASGDDDVAPFQHDLIDGTLDWRRLIGSGLGQLTRPFGTAPVDVATGMQTLAKLQAEIVAAGRFGIPAVAHEECLTGLLSLGATIYPTPLAWGATFNPALIEQLGARIGASMRALGLHQGLGPVLDVTRDARWGRTEETIGEDPYLVATIGTAYVKGMEAAGIVATLKHFAGYSGSRAARNFGPVSVGRREFTEVFLAPFEMAIRDGGARSVMHSYAEVDGIPAASDGGLLTDLLRGVWGFEGTVVADYFGIGFLERLHHVAGSPSEAAALALAAGVDVELPTVSCYGDPLISAVQAGTVPEALVDRAVTRVLRQKCELGLLEPGWSPLSAEPPPDLDSPAGRALARGVAEQSVVLLANDGTLPLAANTRIALIGPLADDPHGMLGCYSFPRHVGIHQPGQPLGVDVPSILDSLGRTDIVHIRGCDVDSGDRSGIEAAVAAATAADVSVVVLGDLAGLFGKGTSGEGCDVAELRLPGVQGELLEAVLATGAKVVLVLVAGRPYALGDYADRLAAVVQTFFPGEEGGPAVAAVLTGEVNPSGKLPISVPRQPGGQPGTYYAPTLGHRTEVSTVDPTALFPFGHGLSYTQFSWENPQISATECHVDSVVTVSLAVRNVGARAGAEVVQLYLHDPVAQVTRPVARLIGYARVELDPGQARRVEFTVPADLASFVGRQGHRVVEPGELELQLAASSTQVHHRLRLTLTGSERTVGHDRAMAAGVSYAEL